MVSHLYLATQFCDYIAEIRDALEVSIGCQFRYPSRDLTQFIAQSYASGPYLNYPKKHLYKRSGCLKDKIACY